ncbi:MAG TPA: PQQ-binding-like beta-propeller repeat protein [Candidatus Eremiobacteraceae bacterium]|nr:PQQ-binding-like beta-propeller repeat protein [Candidatus Eremiobacteraceae bacterium]
MTLCSKKTNGRPDDPGGAVVSTSIDVTPEAMLGKAGENWLSYHGDYSGQRFTRLNQITPSNVSNLKTQWVFHVRDVSDMEVTPVVSGGVMFVTAANDAYALDARTGRTIWHYSRPITEGLIDDASSHHNRGVGLWHSRLFMETDNAHLLCLDALSGHLLWDVAYAPQDNKNYGATSAPLVVKDKVIVGTSGGDDGVRGFVVAFNAETGKEAWRFWTIPAPGEPGNESWPGQMYLRGGGTTWMPGTYDPELNLIFWGTSNPAPDFDGGPRPGDDLYTDCVLAIDPDTGTLKWHFQFTPHDLYDYDATETPVLVDATYKGQPRKLLVQANRNGFLYVLDRTNGAFLSAIQFADKLTWARGIDGHGRPIRTDKIPSAEGTEICPSFAGATNWYSPSYNPDQNRLYFLVLQDCGTFFLKPEEFAEGRTYYATGVRHSRTVKLGKKLMAYDLATNKFAWEYQLVGERDSSAGTLATVTGLVFFGDNSQALEAIDTTTGKPLWHLTMGQAIHASPMSYSILGKQYVAIAAGTDIFSFALP